MAFSKILVSMSFSRSGTPLDSSLALLVARGFSATARTFDSIRSIGLRTSLAASRCIRVIPKAKAATMKAVLTRLSVAVICEFQRTSSTAMEAEQEALEVGGAERRSGREEELRSSGFGRQPVGVASRMTAISEGRRPRNRVDAVVFGVGLEIEKEKRIERERRVVSLFCFVFRPRPLSSSKKKRTLLLPSADTITTPQAVRDKMSLVLLPKSV